MATKTWTLNTDFTASKGIFDGIKLEGDELVLCLKTAFASKTWLGLADEDEEWVGDEALYAKRGHWKVHFDSGEVNEGWADLSWNALEPDSSSVKFRARSGASEAALAGASWTSYYETSPVNNLAPNGQWLELEAVLEEGSTPTIQDITQEYGLGC